MLQLQMDSRQIPKVVKYTANKKYNDLLYGFLQEISELNGKERYIPIGKISYIQIAQKLGLTRQTVSKKFKDLLELGLIIEDKENGKYILTNLEKKEGALIPFKTLRLLNNALSHNAISTYVYLLNRYIAEEETSYIFTLKQIKSFIGVSVNTTSNNSIVTDILQVLKLIGLIEYKKYYTPDFDSYFVITAVKNEVQVC